MTTNSDLAVEIAGLAKAFGATRAIDGVDLVVPRGGVYGFLGPNGAGKTTTIRVVSTYSGGMRRRLDIAASIVALLIAAGLLGAVFAPLTTHLYRTRTCR